MTDISEDIFWLGLCWISMIVLVSRLTIRSADGSVGLPMAFLFSTTFLYCGAFVYLNPDYSHLRTDGDLYLQSYDFSNNTVLMGVKATVTGIIGFAIGCFLASARSLRPPGFPAQHLQRIALNDRKTLMAFLGIFAILGFMLNGVSIPIPMAQAITQVARNVAIALICIGAALAVFTDGQRSYWRWAFLAASIPAAYIIFWGFTSYGFISFTVFAGFWLAVLASRRLGAIRIGAGSIVIVYILISLFVAWMSFRTELRAVLWKDEAGLEERVTAITDAFGQTELLSPSNLASLDLVNGRLNQYIFVGKAMEWHELNTDLWLEGETLLQVLIAWVPRFLWPDKPEMGGSEFVANHTGMVFADGVTFGSGPVFEFYVNYGYTGVLLGFIMLGYLLRKIDRAASRALRHARLHDFIRWFTVGLAFIAPLTELFFIFNTAFMAWAVLFGLKLVLEPRSKQKTAINRNFQPTAFHSQNRLADRHA